MEDKRPVTATWYITRRGNPAGPAFASAVKNASVGPLPTTKVLELASIGELGSEDLLQMAGTDVLISLEQFLGLALGGKLPGLEATPRKSPPPGPAIASEDKSLPDWLDDVAQSETPRPRAPVAPDWLEDVRQSEKLSPGSPTQKATLAAVALDWLDDIRQIEESLRQRPAPPKEASPPVNALREQPPPRVSIPPSIPPMPKSPAPRQPAPGCLEKPGYDPETGKILDPAAYARFQKAEAQRRQDELDKQPAVSVAEVFLDAQGALQEWVDDAANRALVMAGDMEPIRQSASVKELLARYDGYGSVMQEKLCKRLAFLVDNRKKFLKAYC